MSAVAEDLGTDAARLGHLLSRLNHFVERQCGVGSKVLDLHPMEEGHAGLTFGFDVVNGAAEPLGSYVLKLAPVGVARRGNTDVYRQAPLLWGLRSVGMPVPAVPWASPSDDALGTPFIVMERLPGRIFFVWGPHTSFPREAPMVRALWLEAAEVLARLHKVDWQTALPDWEKPRALCEELDTWVPLLRHAAAPAIEQAGAELHRLLAVHIPNESATGVIHGDFQPGNILYVDGKASAIIDWELASIGAQGLDIGWLMMLADASAWPAACRPIAPITRAEIRDCYRGAGGPAFRDASWYQALAQFRLGAIACLNVKLHRSGKRPDHFWESMAPAISVLFARGIELLRSDESRAHGE
jgi:aminoglycoside phosphotransferase (APT) family kinase protein